MAKRRQRQMEVDDLEVQQTHYPSKKQKPKPLAALNEAQGQYISTILARDITFGLGPAGTGKTFIAASLAAEALQRNDIESLTICRPMVGCDESMGFLPGHEEDKYEPWIEPIVDVLNYKLGPSAVKMFFKNGRIVAKPLMFMRGKTHRNSWVILDEAQNTTPEQMKMFLTRIGPGSKLIVDGDPTQSDLKDKRGIAKANGLEDAVRRLEGIAEVGIVTFTPEDIVRHGLVQKIVDAYERPAWL